MMRARQIAGLTLLLVSAAHVWASQPNPGVAAAVLKEWKGQIVLQSGAVKRPLTKSDVARVLREGDVLTCATPNGSFTLLNGAFVEIRITAECTKGYVLPAVAGSYAQILERYGRTGGRSRGSTLGLLLWPESGVRTTPATASRLQWRKQSGMLTATLTEAGSGRILWSRAGIDAALGVLHDAALEDALRAQVEAGKPEPRLDVRLGDALTGSATIALLDAAAERKLQQELTAAGGLAEDARRLVRADVFLGANLPREALEEYMALLERSPDSTLLLSKASALAVEISDPRAPDLVRRARTAEGS
jgi:hypothetical protein